MLFYFEHTLIILHLFNQGGKKQFNKKATNEKKAVRYATKTFFLWVGIATTQNTVMLRTVFKLYRVWFGWDSIAIITTTKMIMSMYRTGNKNNPSTQCTWATNKILSGLTLPTVIYRYCKAGYERKTKKSPAIFRQPCHI